MILQWHARLVHSSGVNFGRNVRVAAIMDFRRCWPSSQLEWMVRTADGHLTMRVKGHEEGGETVGEASAAVREDARILPSLMWHHDVRILSMLFVISAAIMIILYQIWLLHVRFTFRFLLSLLHLDLFALVKYRCSKLMNEDDQPTATTCLKNGTSAPNRP